MEEHQCISTDPNCNICIKQPLNATLDNFTSRWTIAFLVTLRPCLRFNLFPTIPSPMWIYLHSSVHGNVPPFPFLYLPPSIPLPM